MKWSVIASVALASLIKANPIDGDGFDLIERAASKAQFATFDNLKVGASVKVPYLGLNFTNVIVQDQKTRGIVPQTPCNYAINNLGQPYQYPPEMTIDGTSTTSFDLAEFYFACMNAQTKAAVKCQFTVTGIDAEGFRHQGPYLLTYTPSGATEAQMMKVAVGFRAVKLAYTNVYTSDAPLNQTVSFLDSVRYTVYTS